MNILITGASSGIGRQLALDYASDGHNVVVCGRNSEALSEVQKNHPDKITCSSFDITDKASTKEALAKVNDIDVAILCAGVCEYLDTNNFDADMFERVFRVNVFGTMNCVEAMLPQFNPSARLVIVDSLARLLPFTKAQAYGGSKAAMHYIARSLEVDLKPRGIKVQTVSPGFVKTPMTDANDFEMPMRVDVEFASQAIIKGIRKGKRDIAFPWVFSSLLKLMSIFPESLQVKLSEQMARKQSS
ncbi:SDR family NAD(P)-dependent oxidoreductase [Idiomarina sp. HP20-50]|uniref:SDR family NAD(P)-dependent oxidoreductase n=1 Tax=Idiomarina sp. HP20-50 TaxID=3070813 RepID=UPI00294AAED0|nr:SDR family NAD(P)-dependent oxidoreductase [Idiomarina sp. HP20-50]MDV6315016.1 SDR family NAD(P)-dependent oxidoreductase [Idiomarina sp. HP20-50]